jgi:hypothetical protein
MNNVAFHWISFNINYLWGYKLEDMGIGIRIPEQTNISSYLPLRHSLQTSSFPEKIPEAERQECEAVI